MSEKIELFNGEFELFIDAEYIGKCFGKTTVTIYKSFTQLEIHCGSEFRESVEFYFMQDSFEGKVYSKDSVTLDLIRLSDGTEYKFYTTYYMSKNKESSVFFKCLVSKRADAIGRITQKNE